MGAMHHETFDLAALAGAAGAILAAIGQANALPDAGRQDGFIGFGGEGAPTGLYGDLERHSLGILGRFRFLQRHLVAP